MEQYDLTQDMNLVLYPAKNFPNDVESAFKELDKKKELVNIMLTKAKEGSITLLYGTKEDRFNNAVALKEYLEQKIKK